jgi:hypothetical protein
MAVRLPNTGREFSGEGASGNGKLAVFLASMEIPGASFEPRADPATLHWFL